MALKPCSYCGEDVEEGTTVCPHCHTFGPFERSVPEAPDDALSESSVDHDSHVGKARGGWFKGLLKEVGCQYAVGCGGFLAAILIGIVIALIASMCGDGRSGKIDCQELHDWAMEPADWEDTDTGQLLDGFRILEIIPDPDANTTAEHGIFCQAVAQTTEGKYLIWYELEDDGTVSIITEPSP
ncbi:MAG: hypothetical protein F4W95_10060 [Chloroflexi bacterium]|nr:hypothetical protein [Chloroflexota bacterium]MYD48815.1 hypothetical protein [Chloroflexota bacterium]